MDPTNLSASSGIYRITCVPNGKSYIGSTVCFKSRWNRHQWELSGNRHHNHRLQRAWNKHGPTQFEFAVLEVLKRRQDCDSFDEDLWSAEQKWTNEYRSADRDFGYNSRLTARSNLGLRISCFSKRRKCGACSLLPAERDRLIALAQDGDIAARDKVMGACHGLVLREARRRRRELARKGIDHDDAVQCGQLGLMRAIATYDAARDRQFTPHAGRKIWSRIDSELRRSCNSRRVALPVDALALVDHRNPPVGSELELQESVEPALSELIDAPPCDRRMVDLVMIDGYKGEEIAREFGLTRQAVNLRWSRIRKRLIPRLIA